MPDVVSPERIAEIRARLSKITEGQWVADDFCEADGDMIRVGTTDGSETYYHRTNTIAICHYDHKSERENGVPFIGQLRGKWNAEFIADAPQAIRDLLLALDAATAEQTRALLRGTLKGYQAGESDDGKHWRRRAEAAEAECARLRAQGTWQPIETAPKGSWLDGPNRVTHPHYVAPPDVWLLLDNGQRCVGAADAYYAEGGGHFDGGSYWVESFSGERVVPTHWQPLPAPPDTEGA